MAFPWEILDDVCNLYCAVCNIQFTGQIPYADHMVGKWHKKRVKRDGIQELDPDHPSPTTIRCPIPRPIPLTDSNSGSDRCPIWDHNYASISNNRCSSPTNPRNMGEILDDVCNLYCVLCNIQFTGPILYADHMVGKWHKKRLKKDGIREFYLDHPTTISKTLVDHARCPIQSPIPRH